MQGTQNDPQLLQRHLTRHALPVRCPWRRKTLPPRRHFWRTGLPEPRRDHAVLQRPRPVTVALSIDATLWRYHRNQLCHARAWADRHRFHPEITAQPRADTARNGLHRLSSPSGIAIHGDRDRSERFGGGEGMAIRLSW